MIQADLNDAATLRTAMKDAYAVFAVTNYWETMSAETEMKQGRAIADVAKVRFHSGKLPRNSVTDKRLSGSGSSAFCVELSYKRH